MRVLFWFCDSFQTVPTMQTLADAPEPSPLRCEKSVVAFVHVEPEDVDGHSGAETKLVKNAKWVARKWTVTDVVLHSFTHLATSKADPEAAFALLNRAAERLEKAGYSTSLTPYGYFNDLEMRAPGHPLARIYKSF
jgi:hypothetical protein